MATLNQAFGPVLFINMTMAFYVLPWSLAKEYRLFTWLALLTAFALQVWTLQTTYALSFSLILGMLLLSMAFMAGQHLGLKKRAHTLQSI